MVPLRRGGRAGPIEQDLDSFFENVAEVLKASQDGAVIQEVSGQIRGLIEKRLQLPQGRLTQDSSLVDLGADSIAMMDLLLDFEKAFGIEIPDSEAAKIQTVGEAIGSIEKLVLAQRSA